MPRSWPGLLSSTSVSGSTSAAPGEGIRSVPGLVIGIAVSIYWIRVLQMVLRARREAGHDANFVPREKLGRLLRYVWIPVVTLWIALPLFAFFRRKHKAIFQPLYHEPVVAWAAAGVGVIALIATFICWRKMGTSWRMGINPDDKTRLISTGPYAYVRHPIYALSSLLMLATMTILPSRTMLVVGVVHLLLLQWEARREEQYLVGVHGNEYVSYAGRTGRFLPRFFGRSIAS